jgi:hypothetical protein
MKKKYAMFYEQQLINSNQYQLFELKLLIYNSNRIAIALSLQLIHITYVIFEQ